MTDKQTGARAAAEEIIDYLEASAETIEAIIEQHCPQDKAVGKLVEALEKIRDEDDNSHHAAQARGRIAHMADAALAEHERAQPSDVMDFGNCPLCKSPLTSEEHDRSEMYGGKCYNCFEEVSN